MKQKKLFIAAAVVFMLAAGLYYSMTYQTEEEELFIVEDSSSNNPELQKNKSEEEEAQEVKESSQKNELQKEKIQRTDTNEICIYICGKVKRPGVYYLSEGKRVSDIIDMAGGFTKKAAKEQINLAEELTDGEKVYIPSIKEIGQATEQCFEGQKSEGEQPKININQAEPSDLTSLPGIGEAKANAILGYRTEHGLFQKIEDIKKIEGIKDGVFEKIKDRITV